MSRFLACLVIAMLILSISVSRAGDESAAKIEYLLDSIGDSSCVFIRNGKEHDAAAAEDHLRMKYRRGKKWITDADSFISRLATKSSFSGRPYRIRCPGQGTIATADWLNQMLRAHLGADTSG